MSSFISSSLAINETKLVPSKWIYERVEFFVELNRILSDWWVAVINSIYSLWFKDMNLCKKLLWSLWFEVIEAYTWNAKYKSKYHSKVITLKKVSNIDMDFDDLVAVAIGSIVVANDFRNGWEVGVMNAFACCVM